MTMLQGNGVDSQNVNKRAEEDNRIHCLASRNEFYKDRSSNKVVPSWQALPGNPSRVISSTEVASLGSLLCGLTDNQWLGLITIKIFASTLVDHLANLDCAVTEPVKEHLASLLLEVFFSK